MLSNRKKISVIIALVLISLGYAFYAEFALNLEPCPLCIVERVILAAILVPALIFLIHNPRNNLFKYLYSLCIIGISGFGIKVAAHHIWLTQLPPEQQPLSCGMPLGAMYQSLPLHSFLHKILEGDAECAKVTWRVLGINAPLAVLILFVVIILLTGLILFRKK